MTGVRAREPRGARRDVDHALPVRRPERARGLLVVRTFSAPGRK